MICLSLEHTILGLLNLSPMSGYLIKKNFEGPTGLIWPVSYGALYPALHRLEQKGLLEVKEINDPRNQKLYHINQAGRQELEKWLEGNTAQPQYKDEYLLKLMFSGGMTDLQRAELLREYRMNKIELVRELEALKNADRSEVYIDKGIEVMLEYLFRALSQETEILDDIIRREEDSHADLD